MNDIATVGDADIEGVGEAMDSAASGLVGAIAGGGEAANAGTSASETLSDAAIRNYCTWARRELIEQVEARMCKYGIAEEGVPASDADTVGNLVLSPQERTQRARLLGLLRQQPGADPAERAAALADRAAYTWFNRIIAIRFMELHDYLPWHTCVFCSAGDANAFEPQIVKEALDVELPGANPEEVVRLVQSGEDEPLFRYLFLAVCNQLATCLPAVFEPVGAAFELLLPSGLLRKESVIGQLLEKLAYSERSSRERGERLSRQGDQLSCADNRPSSESDEESGGITWDKVEILGWMYQYYNSEVKDDFFKSKRKATARDIAPATQLFTPEWIVRYMVENSLGRLWMLNFPESGLSRGWRYYIKPDERHEDFIRINGPEDIRLCDPACGSGHILVYAFSLLFDMYVWRGYREREIPQLILEKNLTGFEIDPRAAQIANLALAMCARKHDRRFLDRDVRPNVHVVALVRFDRDGAGAIVELPEDAAVMSDPQLLDALEHLDEIGSLFQPTEPQIAALHADADRFAHEAKLGDLFKAKTAEKLQTALKTCESLAKTYDCVIANPPYMGSSSFSPFMSKWIKKNYPNSCRDLCTAFIERCLDLNSEGGISATVTSCTWMFISSFESLRNRLVEHCNIDSLVHTQGPNNHPDVFDANAIMLLRQHRLDGYEGTYFKLDKLGLDVKKAMLEEAIANPEHCPYLYHRNAQTFTQIPATPIAYWASERLLSAFANNEPMNVIGVPRQGLATADNNTFLRFWWEPCRLNERFDCGSAYEFEESGAKWVPHSKGGSFRRWYGNRDYIINWENNGLELKQFSGSVIRNEDYYFDGGITYSDLTSGLYSARMCPHGSIFDTTGPTIIVADKKVQNFLLANVNASIFQVILSLLSPGMHYSNGLLSLLPIGARTVSSGSEIEGRCSCCISLSKLDWDSFETSWDFKRHPLV